MISLPIRRMFFGAALTLMSAAAAQAGPCSKAIDKAQAQLDARLDAIANEDPGARETRAARLHRQPTPASIEAAERGLKGSAATRHASADLARARTADEKNDRRGCEKALAQARAALAR